MKKAENGKLVEMTADEIAELQAAQAQIQSWEATESLKKKKALLAELTKNKAIEAMVKAKLDSIDAMSETALDAAIQAGGL